MRKVIATIRSLCLLLGIGVGISAVLLVHNALPLSHASLAQDLMPTLPAYRSSITPTPTNTCDNVLVMVNKIYALPASYVPPDLVNVESQGIPATSSDLQIRSIVIPDLKAMIMDANTQGINLIVLSPYRSYQTQENLRAGYIAAYGQNDADTFSAIPGHSQHQLGLAIDFSTNEINNSLDTSFGDTKAGKWMQANAYKYGFVLAYPYGYQNITGYEYEPWHYRYIGKQNAVQMVMQGLILEQYLEKYGVTPHC